MLLLEMIQRHKRFDFAGFVPVMASGDGMAKQIGWTKPDLASVLAGYGYVFALENERLVLNPELLTYQARTEAVDAMLLQASAEGFLPIEPDYTAFGGTDWFPVGGLHQPLFEVRRFYSAFLGIERYGSRLNGYHDGHMWVVKRSMAVHEYPGTWDTLVGAGQIAGRSVWEHLLVEAHEEAGLTPAECQNAHSASMFHLNYPTKDGYHFRENIYLYDLDMGQTIIPKIVHEIETAAIELWPYDKVLQILYHTTEFRPEAAMCITDFFIRHGVITPDNEPHYDDLCFALRSELAQT